ncbi:MAG: ROK family protein [Phycisphaerae bacterium]
MNGGFAIGVDLGGQSVKLALVDEHGMVRLKRQEPIDTAKSADQICKLVLDQIGILRREGQSNGLSPSAVGIVMPGYMDRQRTRLLFAANLPTLSGSSLLADLRAGLDLPVTFDADSNGAAFGEYRFGAGQGVNRLTVVAVGTGIGAGVVADGQIVRVRHHIGGSLGHIIVDARGLRCACGGRGCVETVASGRALELQALQAAKSEPHSLLATLLAQRGCLTGKEVAEALAHGDSTALRIVRQCGWWLGVALASWAVVHAPQKVLIGGGVAQLGQPFIQAIHDGLQEVGQPTLVRDTAVELASLGPDAGVVGAAGLALADLAETRPGPG